MLFLAMRYVGNRHLAWLLDRVGRLDPERSLLICGHVAAALDVAHAHDLIHRDVKPGNVLLARDGDGDYAYLCDFGLAKPSLVVLHPVTSDRVQPAVEQLRALARRHRVALGGAAARSDDPEPDGVLSLDGDVVVEAARMTTLVQDQPA